MNDELIPWPFGPQRKRIEKDLFKPNDRNKGMMEELMIEKDTSKETRTITKAMLFAWYSTTMTQVEFPGMKQKIGPEQHKALQQMLDDLRDVIGVVKGNPDIQC